MKEKYANNLKIRPFLPNEIKYKKSQLETIVIQIIQ